MPYIMNALDEDVKVQAHGNWFTFKPLEIKILHNIKLAEFLYQYRGENGLVEIPDVMMEMDKTTQDYKDALYEKRKEGITKYVAKQNYIIKNLELSLRRDYEGSGQKGNFLTEASKGELQAYKNLQKYKGFEAQQNLNTAEEIARIREEMYGNGTSNSTNVRASDPRGEDPLKSTKS